MFRSRSLPVMACLACLLVCPVGLHAADRKQTLAPLVKLLVQADDPAFQLDLLKGMQEGLEGQRSAAMPAGWSDLYKDLSQSDNAEVRRRARELALIFGDPQALKSLRETLRNEQASMEKRRSALDALLAKEDPKLPPVLLDLLDTRGLRGRAIVALGRYDHPETAQKIVGHYGELTGKQRSDAIQTLASRPKWAHVLLDAIDDGAIPRRDLSAFTVRQMVQLDDPELKKKLNQVWGQVRTTPAGIRKKIQQYKKMLQPKALKSADRSRGRLLFRQTCATCHKLFGEGGQVGPDLTGTNRQKIEYLLRNIVDPNAAVGRDYQLNVINTTDGRVISGMVMQERSNTLVVRTLNERVVLAKDKVGRRTSVPTSMMPQGLLQPLDDQQVKDLFAYLTGPHQVPLPGQKPIEGEKLDVLKITGGKARPQPMGNFPADDWSNDAHLWWTGGKPGDRLVLKLPVSKAGKYKLRAVLTKARDYGIVQLTLDGEKLGGPRDLYSPAKEQRRDVVTSGLIDLGAHELEQGVHKLGVEMVGANPDAEKRYMFALDYLLLEPVDSATAEPPPNGD